MTKPKTLEEWAKENQKTFGILDDIDMPLIMAIAKATIEAMERVTACDDCCGTIGGWNSSCRSCGSRDVGWKYQFSPKKAQDWLGEK